MAYQEDSEESRHSKDGYQKNRRFIKSPNFKARDAKLDEIRASIKKVDAELSQISKQIEVTVTPKPIQAKRKELTTSLSGVIKTQADLKHKRAQINDQIKATDMSLKSKIEHIKTQNSKHKYKSAAEIDKRVKYLEELIDQGTLKIVDERRYIKEISALRRSKKDYTSIDAEQKLIDADKEKIKDLRKQLSEANNKEAQEQFQKVTKELDALSLQTKDIQEKRDKLFNRRRELFKQKDSLYDEMRSIHKDYDQQFKKFKEQLEKEKLRRAEEEKEYNLGLEKEKLESRISKIEENSKVPANTSEIKTVENLLVHFDPSFVPSSTSNKNSSSSVDKLNTHHANNTKVELPANAVFIEKKPADFFPAKSKKSRRHRNRKRASKFVLEPVIIADLASLGIALPTSGEDSDKTIAALKEKLQVLQDTQGEKTKEKSAEGDAEVADLKKQIAKIDTEIVAAKEEMKAKEEVRKAEEKKKEEEEEKKEEKREQERKEKKQSKKEEKKN